MENNKEKYHNEDKEQQVNFTDDNKNLNKNKTHAKPDGPLPEDDPALINPDELATFPKEMKTENPDLEEERENHLVNRKTSAARDGRNITRTDTTPDNDGGFM